MKDRIAHIMRAKNLKASDFAALLGIQPSAISHILSGRNQPSLDFIKKIKENFPEYNLDWIVFGTGPITTSEPHLFKPSESPVELQFDSTSPSEPEPVPSLTGFESTPSEKDSNPTKQDSLANTDSQQAAFLPFTADSPIKSIVIFYKDGTFDSFNPR